MAGIYIHIPFCKKRCIYCDFFSTTKSEKIKEYINALCIELKSRKEYLCEEEVETIYLGGGTPSQLNINELKKVFDTIYSEYPVSDNAEITLEANPDDLTDEYIKSLSKLPINRLSIGIQTFNDSILRLLNRRHTANQAIDAYKKCRQAGFSNISIDLMYGLPGESAETWQHDLSTAINLNPEHISAYHLIYEEDTVLYKLKEENKIQEAEEELSIKLFEMLIHQLRTNGYEHYEISNFCHKGYHSRHNSSYWTGIKYLGCGPSAHSYNGNSRQWNISSLEKYIEGMNTGTNISETEILDLYTRYNDFVITTIRTKWGMSLCKLKSDFGLELYNYCINNAKKHIKQGTLEVIDNTLKLTEKGIFISDGIMSDLLYVD